WRGKQPSSVNGTWSSKSSISLRRSGRTIKKRSLSILSWHRQRMKKLRCPPPALLVAARAPRAAMPPPHRRAARQIPAASWDFPSCRDPGRARGYHVRGRRLLCITTNLAAKCLSWFIRGKARAEHLPSAYRGKAHLRYSAQLLQHCQAIIVTID